MNRRPLRFGSICSGIEAASVAWEPLGWLPVWFAEIEPFPSAVLAHHYPDVPNLGDMTRLAARILAGEVEAPDIFVGGTPCQSFSVAGLRKGLDDPRGQLTRSFVEIADAIDTVRAAQGLPPAVILWENVPGVLSDNGNAFGNFLGALAGEDIALDPSGGKWTNAGLVLGPTREVCWRVLDAQYFGVAQRRRRVFVVAGSRVGGVRASQVLLVESGVRRDSPPSREAGQRPAPTLAARTRGGGGLGTDFDLDGGLVASGARRDGGVAWGISSDAVDRTGEGDGSAAQRAGLGIVEEVAPAIRARPNNSVAHVAAAQTIAFTTRGRADGLSVESQEELAYALKNPGAGGRSNDRMIAHVVAPPLTATNDPSRSPQSAEVTAQVHAVLQAQTIAFNMLAGNRRDGTQDKAYISEADFALPLDCSGQNPDRWQGGTGVAQTIAHVDVPDVAWCLQHRDAKGVDSDTKPGHILPVVPYDLFQITAPLNRQSRDERSPCHTLARDNAAHAAVVQTMSVRRLTPRECERLQGFPDDWTLIPWKKKPASECPDGPRYKALGNSMAVPCMNWLGRKINAEYWKRHDVD
jgi:DNA (cytosine-5)-methyltransferase 1